MTFKWIHFLERTGAKLATAIGLVKNVILWRKNNQIPKDMILYSPFGDATMESFVTIFNSSFQSVSFYSRDEQNLKLADALLMTSLINWGSHGQNCVLEGILEKSREIMQHILTEKRLKPVFHIRAYQYTMTKNFAATFKIECPEGIKLQYLPSNIAPFLDNYWPHKFPGSCEYLKTILDRNFGIGIYLPQLQEPVAWGVCSQASCISMVYTLENYRRRGYARLLCKAMAKRLADMDIDPSANVLEDNESSKLLFQSLNFAPGNYVHFMGVRPRES